MAVLLSPVGGVAGQFFDNNGNPLTGGKLYSYVAGTTTPQATYTSSSGVTAHSNPIILDAGGRVPSGEIWLTDGLQYKFVLKNANDVLIGTYDNIVGINSNFINFLAQEEIQTATAGQTVFTLTTTNYQPGTNSLNVFVDGVNQYDGSSYAYVETSSTIVTFTAGLHVGALVKFTTAQSLSSGVTDASLVTYDPPFANSVATTVKDKLAQYVSVKDFGAVGDGVTNDSAAFAAAIAVADNIYIPSGTYLADIAVPSNKVLMGENKATTILRNYTPTYSVITLDASTNNVEFVSISNVSLISNGGGNGIYFYSAGAGNNKYCDNIQLSGIDIYGGFSAAGLNIESRCIWSTFTDIEIRESGVGLRVYSAGDVSQCKFDSCRFAANDQWGVVFENTGYFNQSNTFLNCNIENNNPLNSSSYGGMYIKQVNVLTIQGCYFEGNGTNAKANIYIDTDAVAAEVAIRDCIVQGSNNCIVSNGVTNVRLMTGSIDNIRKGVGETILLNNDHPDNDVSIGNIYPLGDDELKCYFGSNSGVISGYRKETGNTMFMLLQTPVFSIPTIDLRNTISNILFFNYDNNHTFTLNAVPFKNVPMSQQITIMYQNWGAFVNGTLTIQNAVNLGTPIESNLLSDSTPGVQLFGGINASLSSDNREMLVLKNIGANLIEISRSF